MTAEPAVARSRAIVISRVSGASRLLSAIAPLVIMGVLLAVHAVIIAQSMLVQRLWEDEAFNLTVPLNLVAGLGYASDGTLTGSQLTLFDERISTGPVMLLPIAGLLSLGIEPVFAGRLIAAAFWCLLIAGLWVLGRKIAGSWGGLVAAAVPLALNTFQGVSPIQGPADVLGEVAAAALLVWALILMPRHAGWAGLVAGLAIQAKFIALLALPALAIGLLVAAARPPRRWLGVLWRPVLAAMVPTAAYELWGLLTLGWQAYYTKTDLFIWFLRTGGQQTEPTTLLQKLNYFADSWYVPAPMFWVVTAVGIAGITAVIIQLLRNDSEVREVTSPISLDRRFSGSARLAHSEVAGILVAVLLGLLTFIAWWATATQTPLWIRHPAPGLLAFVPVLAAFAVLGLKVVNYNWHKGAFAPPLAKISAVVGMVVFAAVLVTQLALHTQQTIAPRTETLAQQRAEAAEFRDPTPDATWIAAKPWGAPVSIVFLTESHIGLFDAPAMTETPRLQVEACDAAKETLAVSASYFLCRP